LLRGNFLIVVAFVALMQQIQTDIHLALSQPNPLGFPAITCVHISNRF
jgi:hypothetical protein